MGGYNENLNFKVSFSSRTNLSLTPTPFLISIKLPPSFILFYYLLPLFFVKLYILHFHTSFTPSLNLTIYTFLSLTSFFCQVFRFPFSNCIYTPSLNLSFSVSFILNLSIYYYAIYALSSPYYSLPLIFHFRTFLIIGSFELINLSLPSNKRKKNIVMVVQSFKRENFIHHVIDRNYML